MAIAGRRRRRTFVQRIAAAASATALALAAPAPHATAEPPDGAPTAADATAATVPDAPASAAGAPAPDGPAAADRHPDLVRLSPTEEVWIDPRRKEVVVGGRVALCTGPLEVFACPAGTKEHEAVVATKSSAKLVHTALLAIGLEPGRPAEFNPLYRPAEGPAVTIRMRWRDADGNDHECRAQEWIRDAATGKELAVDWVFAGSMFWRNPDDGRDLYQADGGDLVCVSNFPEAMLDIPVESGQANGELIFEAFEGRVPTAGTPVDMVLSEKR
jgi:hypothetical protein